MIRNVKILVVDDDEAVRVFLVNTLTYCVNREVLSFRDGLSAWQYMEKGGRADMVFCDVDMPGMSGLELLSKGRGLGHNLIFILMSGRKEDRDEAAKACADAFLYKPCNIRDLFDIVQTYVVGE